jgi:hypothetical protein
MTNELLPSEETEGETYELEVNTLKQLCKSSSSVADLTGAPEGRT